MSFSWFKAKAPIQSEDDFLWFLMYRTTGVSCLLRTKAYPRSNLAKLISGIGPLTIPVTQIIFLKGPPNQREYVFLWCVEGFSLSLKFQPISTLRNLMRFSGVPHPAVWNHFDQNCLAKIHDLHEPSPFGLQNTICNVVPSRSFPSLS